MRAKTSLLDAILADEGRFNLSAIAASLDMPGATAHRLALTLQQEGYLERAGQSLYLPGSILPSLKTERFPAQAAALRIRSALARLAQAEGGVAHFGILEDGMVNYLVKESALGEQLFTVERSRLEAYCSALGKILLSALSTGQLERYLRNGPFIALTRNTITKSAALKEEIDGACGCGFALDRHEIRDDLFCVAVPVRDCDGKMIGSISLGSLGEIPSERRIAGTKRELDMIAKRARR